MRLHDQRLPQGQNAPGWRMADRQAQYQGQEKSRKINLQRLEVFTFDRCIFFYRIIFSNQNHTQKHLFLMVIHGKSGMVSCRGGGS